MSLEDSEYMRRLCCLIHASLSPHLDSSRAGENEQQLLIALSRVYREIKLWISEFHSDSDCELGKPAWKCECSSEFKPHIEDHHCLTKIIGDLMILLAVESQYVQHLAGKILLAISQFVVVSESNWDQFMQLLCLCLELAICNNFSSSLDSPATKSNNSGYGLSDFLVVLKPRLKNSNWHTVAGIIQVLRNIVKYLSQELDDHHLIVYLDSVSLCFSKVTWDWLNESHSGENGMTLGSGSGLALHHANFSSTGLIIRLQGNLLQFFCSLVEQSNVVELEASGGSLDNHAIIYQISDLIPNLSAWCLGKQGDYISISRYIRHKMLVLMIRLISKIRLECSILLSWLHLLHKYFQDLLSHPITQLDFHEADCLEDSPFLGSVLNEDKISIPSHHLQRLAIFLFLKCSLSLISLTESSNKQYLYANQDSFLDCDLHLDQKCCGINKGLLELSEWLRGHLPADVLENRELNLIGRANFAMSFLQLYMHEDDILFEVLLLLFGADLFSKKLVQKEREMLHAGNSDMLHLISDLFCPMRLFHLFLAELLYDHQVLLDYLISKDTGATSAEYLLKCLRTICNSWNVFVEFSLNWELIYQSSHKKRKVVALDMKVYGEISSASVKSLRAPLSLDRKGDVSGIKHHISTKSPLENAKKCLLSLKSSLENLHHKNLFPYNPEVLLRRLRKFQELCDEKH